MAKMALGLAGVMAAQSGGENGAQQYQLMAAAISNG